MNKMKIIRTIDFAVIIGSLISVILVVQYARPMVIAPLNDVNTTNEKVLFEFANAEKILIDDNINFTSPEEIAAEDNLVVNLKPGHYYWKIVGLMESEIKEFTINSEIDLKIKKLRDSYYEITNNGNSKLNVDVYDNGGLTGSIVLDVDDSKNVSGTKFIGGGK